MNNKCKRLGNSATKKDLREAARVKREMKLLTREFNAKTARENRDWIYGNLSKEHPEYGETPVEQTRRMLENNT